MRLPWAETFFDLRYDSHNHVHQNLMAHRSVLAIALP